MMTRAIKRQKKYQVFSKSIGGYLGLINQTLRVIEVPSGEERHKHALQCLIDQDRADEKLIVIPYGEHKKSKVVSLSDIAPRKVGKKTKKRRIDPKVQTPPVFDFSPQ
jgi:hypothetical protein